MSFAKKDRVRLVRSPRTKGTVLATVHDGHEVFVAWDGSRVNETWHYADALEAARERSTPHTPRRGARRAPATHR